MRSQDSLTKLCFFLYLDIHFILQCPFCHKHDNIEDAVKKDKHFSLH